jgi:hypothetical protein
MLLIRAASTTRASGRGWTLEIENFLVPVKWQVLNAFKEKGKDSDPEHCRNKMADCQTESSRKILCELPIDGITVKNSR